MFVKGPTLLFAQAHCPGNTRIFSIIMLLVIPDDLLVLILRYLPSKAILNTSLICKRIRTLSYDSRLWKRVELDIQDERLLQVIKTFAKDCQMLRINGVGELSFRFMLALEDWVLETKNIQTLILSDGIYTLERLPIGWDRICKYLTNLKVLILDPKNSGLPSNLVLDFIRQAVRKCPKVEVFSEQIIHGIPVGYIGVMSNAWKNLKSLKVNTEGIKLAPFETVLAGLDLKMLSVTHFSESLKRKGTLQRLIKIFSGQKALKYLSIDLEWTQHMDGIDSKNLPLVISAAPYLETFIYKIAIETYLAETFGTEKLQYEMWTKTNQSFKNDKDLPLVYFKIVSDLADEIQRCKLSHWELHWNY